MRCAALGPSQQTPNRSHRQEKKGEKIPDLDTSRARQQQGLKYQKRTGGTYSGSLRTPRELLKESCGWGKPHRSTKFVTEKRQQSLQAEVFAPSCQKFRMSPKAQESQVTRVWGFFLEGRGAATGEEGHHRQQKKSCCSDSTGTCREHLPRCSDPCGKAMSFIL